MVGLAVVEVVEVVVWEAVVLVPAAADALTSLVVVVVGVVEWVGVPEQARRHWQCAEGCAETF